MPTARRSREAFAIEAPVDLSTLSLSERLAHDRQLKRQRKKNLQFILGVASGCLFLGLLLALMASPFLGVGAGGGLACLILSYRFPQMALYAFLAYMPFAGTVIYAISPSGNAALQLAKDGFYVPACVAIFMICQKKGLPFVMPAAIKIPLFIFLSICGVTLLFVNGAQQLSAEGEKPILMGILGLKVIIGYFPLITCVYYLLRTHRDLERVLRLQVLLIITCCALAFVQYMMLKTGRCQGTVGSGAALFQASIDSRCFVGGALLYTPEQGQIRLPGTFVAPWQWGWFLISASFFAFTSAFSDPKWSWRMAGLTALAATMMMAVLSGQRIALALVPVAIATQLVLTGQIVNLKRFIPIGVGLACILGVAMLQNPALVQERITSFQTRWAASPPTAFIEQQMTWVWSQQEGIFGNGLGRATNSARSFGETELIETYHPKVMYEIGPIGLVALLGLYTAITIATFKIYRSVKDRELRQYGACLWVFVIFISYFPYYYPLDVDPVAVYYWLAIGIITTLPKLDQQKRDRLVAEAAAIAASGQTSPADRGHRKGKKSKRQTRRRLAKVR